MFSKTTVAAFMAGFAAVAYAQEPKTFDPSTNPIHSPLTEVVPACKPYEITWGATTASTEKVTILLLKGPPTNLVKVTTIAASVPNTGSFSWTPESSLEATTGDTGYGLQLIIDSTGLYQYSNQFGINTDGCSKESTSKSSAAPESTGYPVSSSSESKTAVSSSVYPTAAAVNSTTFCSTTTAYVPSGTGASGANSTVVLPTKSMSVPASLKTSATGAPSGTTSSGLPESTGAASGLKAGLSLAGAVAGLVLML